MAAIAKSVTSVKKTEYDFNIEEFSGSRLKFFL